MILDPGPGGRHHAEPKLPEAVSAAAERKPMRISRLTCSMIAILALAGCRREGVPGVPEKARPPVGPPVSKAAEQSSSTTPVELVRQARQAIAAGDLPKADRLLEDCLKRVPDDRSALFLLSEVTQFEAQDLERPASLPYYLRSARAIRALSARYPDLTVEEKRLRPTVFYNEACTRALAGESTDAVKALEDAVDAGFESVAQVEADDMLDSLRVLPGFLALKARMERTQVERLLAQTTPFPFDFALNRPDGTPLALSSLKGNVVLVAFSGTWCPPCRKEVPHLVKLYRKYRGKGLEIVSIYLEIGSPDEAMTRVSADVKERAIPFPCVIGNESTSLMVPGFEGLPTLIALDARGKVRLKVGGYLPFSALDAIAARLLEEKAGGTTAKPSRLPRG